MSRDFRDLCIETLADSEAELRERVVSLEQDVQAYRELAQQAIHALHALTHERDRLRAQLARLRDVLRFVREELLRRADAA